MSALLLAFVLALPAPARTEQASDDEKAVTQKLWRLGLSYFAQGDAELARVQWLACSSMDLAHEDCRQALEGLKKLGGAPAPAPEAPKAKAKARDEKPAKASKARKAAAVEPGKPAAPVPAAAPPPAEASALPQPQDREGRKEAAILHWNEGTLQYQKGALGKARDAWNLCNLLDPGNRDCLAGLQLLESRIAAGAPLTASRPRQAAAEPDPAAKARREAVRHWNAGILHFQNGDLEKARHEWQLCSQADSSNLECRTGLQRVEQSLTIGGP